jgi:NTE family protein
MADREAAIAGSGTTAPPRGDRGWCLCLSGGGFRATLFHLGVVLRLNELGVLSRLSTITSVSGGSILNGVLATRWAGLEPGPDGTYANLVEQVAGPVRTFCSKDLRTPILLGTRLDPRNLRVLIRDWYSVSANFLAGGYEGLYRSRLSDLPAPGPGVPRFIFCATNVRTGACWHFHGGPRARMGDFYDGYCDATDVRVSDAVAASSAFPPGFSALRLNLPAGSTFTRSDPWGDQRVVSEKREGTRHGLDDQPVLLTDGGVYDNLAVEPVWKTYKTLLVSDAGRPFQSLPGTGQALITRLRRAAEISMEQVASVRKRWLVDDFAHERRTGAIWTLHTRLEDFPLPDRRGYGPDARTLLHGVRTDLDAFSASEIACLENHGYSLADAALRSHAPALCPNLTAPFQWPNDDWCEDRKVSEALKESHRRRILRDVARYVVGRTHL